MKPNSDQKNAEVGLTIFGIAPDGALQTKEGFRFSAMVPRLRRYIAQGPRVDSGSRRRCCGTANLQRSLRGMFSRPAVLRHTYRDKARLMSTASRSSARRWKDCRKEIDAPCWTCFRSHRARKRPFSTASGGGNSSRSTTCARRPIRCVDSIRARSRLCEPHTETHLD